jgi:two-component system phosphate regulon sensor histidine kinase PhoR
MTDAPPHAAPSRFPGLARRSAVPLLLAIAGGLLAGWLMNRVLDDAIAGRTEASAFSLLSRVGPDVEAVLASNGDPAAAVDRLGRQLSLRATLVAADGRVIGDSAVEQARLAELENHAGRPEVREALREGRGVRTRFSSTLGRRLVYAAIRLRGGEVLRFAFLEKELAEWEAPFRRRTLVLSVLAGLLVGVLFVLSRSRQTAELRVVREAVAAAGRGERPAHPGSVSGEAAGVLAALGDLADLARGRDSESRRHAAVSRAVFDAAPVGLLVVDSRLSLLDANPEALRLLGAAPGALRPGEHVLELVREKALADLLAAALADGKASSTLQPLRPGEGRLTLQAEALRVDVDGSATPPAVVAILRETPSPRPG